MAIIIRAYESADVSDAINIWNGRFKSGGTVVAALLKSAQTVVAPYCS